MAIQAGDYAYIGVGRVFMKRKCADEAMLHIGNVSALSFGVSEDVKEQRDYTSAGGGTTAESRRISSVECSMTLLDLDKTNIARAFFGNAYDVGADVHTKTLKAYIGGYIPLQHPVDETVEMSIKKAGVAIDPTQFEASSGGVRILKTAIGIADGDEIEITYTSLPYGNVEAITETAQEYELFFEGLNEAKSGSPVNVHAHKIKFGATTALNLINEDFASFEIKGKLLRDNCKKGKGVSKYFKVQIVKGDTVNCCDEGEGGK